MPICVHIPPAPAPQRLVLPGGVALESVELLKIVQPALTPLAPVFSILDALLAVVDAVRAVPGSLGPPPDPTQLVATINRLMEKVTRLLQLVPQLSIPLTIVGLIDLVIAELGKTRDLLVHLQAQVAALAAARARAAELGDAQLLELADCAQQNLEQEAANAGAALGALGSLIGVLNLFMGLIGGPTVPDLALLSGQPLDGVIPLIDGLVGTLRAARSAVPLP